MIDYRVQGSNGGLDQTMANRRSEVLWTAAA